MIEEGSCDRVVSNGVINGDSNKLDSDRDKANSEEMLDSDSEYPEFHPFVEIVEQPAPNAIRFRYEGRSSDILVGKSSTKTVKTYPAIRIVNYSGKAVVVVSCVTKDPPFRPHPHNLLGTDGCKKGVCTLLVPEETMALEFRNLAIQCVKRDEVSDSLRVRRDIRVDPYQTGYDDMSLDLTALRLCFQVFLADDQGRLRVPLKPIVSEPISDPKVMQNLAIKSLSGCTSSVAGGARLILLCDRVDSDDIAVRFYERTPEVEWEDFGRFSAADVHNRTAIELRTPAYRDLMIVKPVEVRVELVRLSDGACSDAVPFLFCPLDKTCAKLWTLFRQCEPMLETGNGPDADAMSYTSIQMAFKNPLIEEVAASEDFSGGCGGEYDDVCEDRSVGESLWHVGDRDSPPLPLPPKRYRPRTHDDARKRASCVSCYTIALNDREADRLIRPSAGVLRSVSLRSTAPLPPPPPPLPQRPHRKKPGFLRRFFSRAKFDPEPVPGPGTPRRFLLATSPAAKKSIGSNERATSTNQPSRKPLKYYSSNDLVIHIPLRDSDDDGDADAAALTAENDTSELTEAENYALYTDVAPFATQSEFDDMSCLYGSIANRNC